MNYVTADTVAASLDDPAWFGSGNPDRAVKMANAWLNAQGLPTYASADDIPQPILDAGAEIASECAAGKMFTGRTEGVVKSKESSAQTGTHVKKTYADGAQGQPITAGEELANSLIQPYIMRGLSLSASLTRI